MMLHQKFSIGSPVLILLFCASIGLGQSSHTLRGRIVDATGEMIAGATVTLVEANAVVDVVNDDQTDVDPPESLGLGKTATTDYQGLYIITGLAPGYYTVRARASGFAVYRSVLLIPMGRVGPLDLNIQLSVAIQKLEVMVTSLNPSHENNAGALVLREAELEVLPDDPDDLEDALLALAGPSAGPNGAQFYVDGFTGGRLPPKSSISEVRINQNPFSAEFDRLGYGRIEVITKAGTAKFRGEASMNFNDESLNSGNPFAPNRIPYQLRRHGGNLSGPLKAKKSSFFLDFQRQEIDENAVINATILDSELNTTRFRQIAVTPQRRTTFSPRLDYQLNDKNTLVARYSYTRSRQENQGIGGLSLLSRSYNSSLTAHEVRITEKAVINPRVVIETRLRYEHRQNERSSPNAEPGLQVPGAFTGGGPQLFSYNVAHYWELRNSMSWMAGRHSVKMGGHVRGVHIMDVSKPNFGGTFTFGGGLAPQLDANNQVVLNATGNPVMVRITGLERYRRTLLFQRLGKTPPEVIAVGGGATQFTIAREDPEAGVNQVDFGGYFNQDWRLRRDLLLSLGLRYEIQTNIRHRMDFAPRVAFAWSPGASPNGPMTVVRGGIGFFYDRFGENFTLDAHRFDGVKQEQFIVRNPDFFPGVPPIDDLQVPSSPRTIRRVADDLRSPSAMQTALSIERQLPFGLMLSTSYINMRMSHVLGSRNINAPLPGTFQPDVPGSGVRPFGTADNIYHYRSDGLLKQNQLIVGLNYKFRKTLTLLTNYTLSQANSSTEGAFTFPADPYDFSAEYSTAGFNVHHRFVVLGSIVLPWGMRLNPFVIASSGRAFNITTGRDTNGDGLLTERPALATDPDKPGVVVTRWGAFDPNPAAPQAMIPRNFGQGPGLFLVNLTVSKTFSFAPVPEAKPAAKPSPAGGPPSGGSVGSAKVSGGKGQGGGQGGGRTRMLQNITFSIQVQNLFNHTNFGPVVGNLGSPLFGKSDSTLAGFGYRGSGAGTGTAGKRRIELQLRFSF